MCDILLSTISSLVVALISVAFSHYIAQKIKFKSNFKGVITEIEQNISLIKNIKAVLREDCVAMEEGKTTLLPMISLNTFAFDYFVLEGHMTKLSKEDKQNLVDIYDLFKLINRYVNYYEETKCGVLYVTGQASKLRENIRLILEGEIIPKLESFANKFIQKHSN